MKKHLFLIALFISFTSFCQSKEELLNEIIAYQRAFYDNWLETSLENCHIKVIEKAPLPVTGKELSVFKIDLSKVKSVAVKKVVNKQYGIPYYTVTLYLKDESCRNESYDNFEDYKNKILDGYPFYHDARTFISFKENEKRAKKFQKIISDLAKLCGAKKIITFD